MARVADFTVDGRSVGDEPIRVRQPSVHEIRLAPKAAELELAARALAHLGERDVAFAAEERPDRPPSI
jgi:hypothetical protein